MPLDVGILAPGARTEHARLAHEADHPTPAASSSGTSLPPMEPVTTVTTVTTTVRRGTPFGDEES